MSCEQAEDVCQHCLKKVEREEEALQKKSPPEKTITRDNKRNKILFNSALLAGVGYTAYYNVKFFLTIFDFSVTIVKDILETITTRTREE